MTNETKTFLNTPADGRLTSWLFTSVAGNLNADYRETNPSGHRGILDPGTSGLQVQRANLSATPPPQM